MIGAYQTTRAFAYPAWRLTVPGGPAGGHYKGFTHTESAGTDIPPNDQYEQDREDGMSSHDAVHASLRNPRGVYRSAAEVPPRPNASGSAMTYKGGQTRHHAGTAVAPGSFPADYFDTLEDAFLKFAEVGGLGAVPSYHYMYDPWGREYPIDPIIRPVGPEWPVPVHGVATPLPAPSTGATSVVRQPAPTPLPLPPAQAVPVHVAPPISPTPAPIVATNEVVPANDGSGNYINLSTGTYIPAASVIQNPATGQLTASPAADPFAWLQESTLFSSVPNWGVVGGGLLLAMLVFKGKR
jgi:hypothetical protein